MATARSGTNTGTRSGGDWSGAGQIRTVPGAVRGRREQHSERRLEQCGGCRRAPRYLCGGGGRVLPEARAGPAPPHVAVFIWAGPAREAEGVGLAALRVPG